MEITLLLILPLAAWPIWRAFQTGAMPAAGNRAPDFFLPDQHGKPHTLSDYTGRWLVLYFYPRNDTPGCTREACTFRDGLAELQAAGATVLGVSVDSVASHAGFAEKHRLNFPLLADAEGSTARRYGVLTDWKFFRFARRNTFLINPEGRISHVCKRIDPARHAGEILAALVGTVQQNG